MKENLCYSLGLVTVPENEEFSNLIIEYLKLYYASMNFVP